MIEKQNRLAAYITSAVTFCAIAAVTLVSGCGDDWPNVNKSDELDTYLSQFRIYKSVVIGGKTWMRENLNYSTGNSWCYDDNPSNCARYGRLYDWETAKRACPAGWHLPSSQEWKDLVRAAGDYYIAGKRLKSRTGWNYYYSDYVGTDEFGFSALPGGYFYNGYYYDAGNIGLWWTATDDGYSDGAYVWVMHYSANDISEAYDNKNQGYSVRCVHD